MSHSYISSKVISRREALAAFGIVLPAACARLGSSAPQPSAEIILCGWDEVFILALDDQPDPGSEKVWSWRAADSPEIPEAMRPLFRSTDECKPVDGGRRILITSSSNGVALVERATKRALFHATAANAHSAAMLPGERTVVAASVSPSGKGDRLVLFGVDASGRELWSGPLAAAHGVVWDARRALLWGLGGSELRSWRLAQWDGPTPALEPAEMFRLPDPGGHDLFAAPGENPDLFVTTNDHCWLFDRDRRAFRPHPVLADAGDIKCLSAHARTGRVVYTQAERPNWWTARVRFLDPPGLLHLPGERLYKARWDV